MLPPHLVLLLACVAMLGGENPAGSHPPPPTFARLRRTAHMTMIFVRDRFEAARPGCFCDKLRTLSHRHVPDTRRKNTKQ